MINTELCKLLLSIGKITKSELKEILEKQKKSGNDLKEVLLDSKIISEDDITDILELNFIYSQEDLSKYKVIDLDRYKLDECIVKIIPENIVRRHELIAIDKRDDVIVVAMVDPLNIFAIDDLKLYLKSEIEPVISTRSKILRAIEKNYSKENTRKALEEFIENYSPVDPDNYEEKEVLEVTSAPVVKLLNSIIEEAIKSKASDIHIEPYSEKVRIRIRIDGDLREIMTLSRDSISALITRVKIIGKMDIAERRVPQDGRVKAKVQGKEIDMRISILPTVDGEKVVIRILDKSSFVYTKDFLGFNKRNLELFDKILSQPHGIFLAVGPTGSGKTTTLFTILKELNSVNKNIITIEDPVEYKIDGINQVQTNDKTGLNFATGLRSILRQDPDIIMVGEIRDTETAKIAIRAAITGHLVLSTLHTNDSPSTISRLIDMGIEPYLVSSAVIGIISQRLIKKLCEKCKITYEIKEKERQVLSIDKNQKINLYKAVGCKSCNSGYKGRIAIHELMEINEEIRRLIDRGESIDGIRNKAIENGMTTLLQSASELAIRGVTSYDEVIKFGFTNFSF